MHYEEDFGMVCRIGRFHNIYGPCGTWKGGREKAPAAFCRKAITSTESFEMWGNGKQTRSFCYIDDAVEGILRLMVNAAAAAAPSRRATLGAQFRAQFGAQFGAQFADMPSPHLASPLLRRRTTRSRSTSAPTRWSR